MTVHVSVPLFLRNGRPTFKAPRKEVPQEATQARKAAARHWAASIAAPDQLTKICVVTARGPSVHVAERDMRAGRGRWVEYGLTYDDAAKSPHIAACLAELGADRPEPPPPMPDVLEINGVIYRREI